MILDEQKIYTVSELNRLVDAELSESAVRVKGEVSDFKRSQNGKFIYFDLKDEDSRLNCFIMAFRLRQEVEDGMEVIVSGSPGLYVPYGKYTFRVETVEPVGEGALKRAFELTKKKLEAEGIFRDEYKKPLPRFPECIGLITSREAAAYSDFLRILKNRWRGVEVLFYNVHVQGADAADEIIEALGWFNAHKPVDALVLTRGGGSLEDLQAFNNEAVVRAIFASKIPVVVGVGHERDVTLADLVADRRASTPSNAAEIIVPNLDDTLYELDVYADSIERGMTRALREPGVALESLTGRLERSVAGRLERGRSLAERLEAAFGGYLARTASAFEGTARMLEALNPQAILARGYSITTKDGKVLKDASGVSPGDQIETTLYRGRISSFAEKDVHSAQNVKRKAQNNNAKLKTISLF